MIVFWVIMSLLSWLLCLIPLYLLALSEIAAFAATAIAAPMIGFWLATISLQWFGAIASVHAGLAVAVCGLVYFAGYRWSALLLGAMVIAILQPWTYINWSDNLLGSVALYAVIFPGYTAYVLLKKVYGILDMGAHGLNETNLPVVIFSLLSMAASVLFVTALAYTLLRRNHTPSA